MSEPTTYFHLGLPVSFPLPHWKPPVRPPREPMPGRFCRLEPLSAEHASELYAAYSLDATGALWTYLPAGPFDSLESFRSWLEEQSRSSDPLFFTIVDEATGQAVGLASYLRMAPAQGSIEVGHLCYSPRLQRTPAATEAMFLMMQRAFDLGYRRYEWKCDALHAKSRAAAQRLGFSFEGIFRQASVYKGRNRDTAWYAILDREWPQLKSALTQWLDPSNFDEHGRQQLHLSDLTAPLLFQKG
jgi:RimJ/RimL family protein N-acetyltransferase